MKGAVTGAITDAQGFFRVADKGVLLLLWAEWLQQEVLAPVPHRHVVLTMPRLLRGIFRKRGEFLLDLSHCAAKALAE